jgi:V8-like Glu-specific endopeptidase
MKKPCSRKSPTTSASLCVCVCVCCSSDPESANFDHVGYPLERQDPRAKLPEEFIGVQEATHETKTNEKEVPNEYISVKYNLKTKEKTYELLEPNTNKEANTQGSAGTFENLSKNSKIAEQSSPVVMGTDSRTPINNPLNLALPYRTTVKIFPTFPNGTSGCTGTLVGSRVVATSAHCLYQASRGGWVTGVRVMPALEYDYMPFGDANGSWVEVQSNWIGGEDSSYDFGLITLDRPLGDLTGWVGVTTSNDPLLAYSLHGYPIDLPAPPPDPRASLFMYGMSDVPRDYNSDLLYYETDTAEGQSGSGLIRFINGSPYATSTHRGTCYHYWSLGYLNCSVRYTSSRVNMVAQAISQANNYPVIGMANGTPWNAWNGWTQLPPTLVSYGLGNWTQAFVVGGDNQVYTKTHTVPSNPGGWYLRTGATTATPVSAVKRSGGGVDAVVRALDGSVKYMSNAVSGSSGWQNLGGSIVDAPAVVEVLPARVEVFGVSPNRRVFQNVITNNSGNTIWYDLGGTATSNVTAISKYPNTIDLFVLGLDGSVWTKRWNGSSWQPSDTGWTQVGGLFSGQISAVAWDQNRMDLFGLGQASLSSSKVFQMTWTSGGGWTGPFDLFGTVVGGVTAVSGGPNKLDIFARSPNGGIFQKTWNGGPTWLPSNNGWTSLGGDMMEIPSVVAIGNTIDVVARGKEGQLWNRWWNGSQWQ